jgi:hypothetical protein
VPRESERAGGGAEGAGLRARKGRGERAVVVVDTRFPTDSPSSPSVPVLHARTHARTHAHAHARTHTDDAARTHARTQASTRARVGARAREHTNTRAHIHTLMHAFPHMLVLKLYAPERGRREGG